ncbi:hypothetical protein TrRE_jg13287 [Triparma retinervis]|uniref:Uncharacterized protein n=1 Tax=Triparma retinervis TaxID=2557542 RepID=A0A9W7DZ59_9STRA|nr:hypothetical protein TrRE_jg13287 [Triparma retinervis]
MFASRAVRRLSTTSGSSQSQDLIKGFAGFAVIGLIVGVATGVTSPAAPVPCSPDAPTQGAQVERTN